MRVGGSHNFSFPLPWVKEGIARRQRVRLARFERGYCERFALPQVFIFYGPSLILDTNCEGTHSIESCKSSAIKDLRLESGQGQVWLTSKQKGLRGVLCAGTRQCAG